jgi:hypothetical protein
VSHGLPEIERGGCGGVFLLSLLTVAVLLWVIPSALWFPFGMFYESFEYDDWYISRAFQHNLTNLVWFLVSLLGAINLAWMIHLIALSGHRPPSDPGQLPALPDGITDHFVPPDSVHIKSDKGIRERP